MAGFSIERKKQDGVEFVCLVDAGRGESVSIAPEFGGNVNELILSKNGTQYSIIDGFRTYEEFAANDAYKGVKLLPFPNRIANGKYVFEGREHHLQINEPELDHAHHGFFYHLAMFEEAAAAGDDFAEVTLRYDYRGDRDGYPFNFKARISYRLHGTNKFSSVTEIENTGATSMPLGDGWHPYFRIGETIDDLTLRLPKAREILLDERMIPLKSQPDAGYADLSMPLRGLELDSLSALTPDESIAVTEIHHADEDVTIRVWQETGAGKYNFLCVYTPPHRKSVAVEPMTCAINGFNNGLGLIVLEPREKLTTRYGVNLS